MPIIPIGPNSLKLKRNPSYRSTDCNARPQSFLRKVSPVTKTFDRITVRKLSVLILCLAPILLAGATWLSPIPQEQFVVVLKNGMVLGPGPLSDTDSMSTTGFQRGGNAQKAKNIGIMDDGLRLTYFSLGPKNFTANPSNAAPLEEIEMPSAREVARSGNPPSIRQLLGVSAFNKYGRRTFKFVSQRGPTEVLQGITLLTPEYAKIEILNTERDQFIWDTRISTSSIPPDQLRAMLDQVLDLEKSGEWLRMVRFYMQAKRYGEARNIMTEALQRFPGALASRTAVVEQLDQFFANDKFEEIKLRRDAGQHMLAARYLGAFPVNALPLESQTKLQTEVETAQQRLVLMGNIAEDLRQKVDLLNDADQKLVQPIIAEVLGELSHNSLVRLNDFNRLRSDDATPNEDKVALAISGWILGSGSGVDNFAIAKSLIRVRTLVIEYLNQAPPPRRQTIMSLLRAEEGARPDLLAKILENLKPPQPQPAINENDPPGLFRCKASRPNATDVDYLVQLPPEYDPNRKYPCILALPGRGDVPDLEINYWCGVYSQLAVQWARSGYATRKGYIVVSPNWMTPEQTEYKYTEAEHSRILRSMRDALRRFNIDTDRIYLSGHYAGATAAWDLASSHPDLWAGAIPISPVADKFIVQYRENLRGQRLNEIPLGTYIVYGELDGKRIDSKVGTVADEYVRSQMYDSMVVEYRGRGSGLFTDEIPRMFEWMELSTHRRVTTPRAIDVKTMRSGDRFFYWLEAPSLNSKVSQNPYQIDVGSAGNIEAELLTASPNTIRISKIPSDGKRAWVWLTPDMVDFANPVKVIFGRPKNFDVSPDIGVMLEDVRTRGDRYHPFWAKIEL